MSDNPGNPQDTLVIEPGGRLFDLRFGELWEYRDLVVLFVQRDFVAEYKQTVLGPLWHLLQPLVMTVVFTVIFGRVAKLSTDGLPPFVFYMAGSVIWTYFANVLTTTSGTFRTNMQIFGKVYFPRLALPLAGVVTRLIAFFIQYLLFLGVLGFFAVRNDVIDPNAWVLITPLLLLMMAAFSLGIGLVVSAITIRYRDIAVLTSFGIQMYMYASPVIYPISSLPEKWQAWAGLNPVAPIIELFRFAYLGQGWVDFGALLQSGITILVVLLIGIVYFNHTERNFLDTI